MTPYLSNISLDQLKRAVQIKEQIVQLQTELSNVLGAGVSAPQPKPSSGMSPAAKSKISAAAKARWAKIKAGKQPSASTPKSAAQNRKPMSAAQKGRLAAMMKARWAKVRAAGKKRL